MRIWFDTEFIDDGKTIDLISIGLVRDDGADLYLESAEADLSRAGEWVVGNVFPYLRGPRTSRGAIAQAIREFSGDSPEFWANYAAYDWVVLCQLYGTMLSLPAGWPMYCRDLQWLEEIAASRGSFTLPEFVGNEHNALDDARDCRRRWELLTRLVTR